MKLFVGNFDPKVTVEGLTALFSKFGQVTSCYLIRDRKTGQSQGYGFVTVEGDEQAEQAIKALHGMELKGRHLIVSKARGRNSSTPPADAT